ncbi:MAG TPA: HipA family kinase [Sporichthyaceae bacterium]
MLTATRYITPLREGGSLPGLMETDDLGTYVVKFHGAGQGRKVLIAEVICTGLARALGLPVPDLGLVDLDPLLAPAEPDEEVQDLLRRSAGLNLGIDFLPGSLDFDPAVFEGDPALSGRVLWFDALVQNMDRSWRNPNMLHWHGHLVLIDHGAALVFHHEWSRAEASVARPYDAEQHALIRYSPDVTAASTDLARLVTDETLTAAVADVPDLWLVDEPGFDSAAQVRAAYVARLRARLAAEADWLPALAACAARAPVPDKTAVPTRARPAWLRGRRR